MALKKSSSNDSSSKKDIQAVVASPKKTWMKTSIQPPSPEKVQTNGGKHLLKFWICDVTDLIILRLINPSRGANEPSYTYNLNKLYPNHPTLKKYFIGQFVAGKGYDRLLDKEGNYAQHGFVFLHDPEVNPDKAAFIKSTLVPGIQQVGGNKNNEGWKYAVNYRATPYIYIGNYSLSTVFTYTSTAEILQNITDFDVEAFISDRDACSKLFPGLENHDIKNFFDVEIVDGAEDDEADK